MTKFCLRIDKPLDLDATLDCGQTFRWTARDGWWTGIVRNTVIRLKQERNELRVKASSDSLLGRDIDRGLISYLGLEDNLEEIHIDIEKKLASMNSKVSDISKKALEEARGTENTQAGPLRDGGRVHTFHKKQHPHNQKDERWSIGDLR